MSDRGEKIVLLAQELLESGQINTTSTVNNPNRENEGKIIMRAACVATILATATGVTATNIYQECTRPASRYEQTEVKALLFYIARELEISQETIIQQMEAEIGKLELRDYSASTYQRARTYLQDRLLQKK